MGNSYEIYVLLYVIKTVEGITRYLLFSLNVIETSKVVRLSVAGDGVFEEKDIF